MSQVRSDKNSSAKPLPSLRRDKQQEAEDLRGGVPSAPFEDNGRKKKKKNYSADDIDPEIQRALAQKLEEQFKR